MSLVRKLSLINIAFAATALAACRGAGPNGPINPLDTTGGPPPGNQGTWSVAGNMPAGRSEFGATAYRGKIYVAGGLQGGATSDGVHRYDPATDQWEKLANLPEPRFAMPLVVVGDTIYGVGGLVADGLHVSTLWAYLPDQDQWVARARLPERIIKGGVAALNGEVFYAGGSNGLNPVFDLADSIAVYNPTSNTWRRAAPLITPRTALSVVSVGGLAYATAGINVAGGLPTTEVFDANSQEWSELPDAFTPRLETSAALLRGRIHVIGGFNRDFLAIPRHEVYDPNTATWDVYPDLPVARSAAGAVTLNDKIYVLGGADRGGGGSERVDVFTLN